MITSFRKVKVERRIEGNVIRTTITTIEETYSKITRINGLIVSEV